MRINQINNNLNFQSGLNSSMIHKCRHTDVNFVEKNLLKGNISADFGNTKVLAFVTERIFEIFRMLKNKTNARIFEIIAPKVQVYDKSGLNFDFQGYGFCVPETQLILKDKPPFETGSVFFEKENSIEEINEKLDKSFKNGERSSSHFLAPFVHEFLHGSYLNYIYKKFGYEGQCPYTRGKYGRGKYIGNDNDCGLMIMTKLKNLKFNEPENAIIEDVIGKYATTRHNQYHEVFAETFTKLICDSLSEDSSLPTANPLDKLKVLPAEFLLLLKKVFV